jgi:hydrogenase maturation protease
MIDAETVVLGVGSPLMGDDGLGVAALEAMRDRWEGTPGLAFVDGGTWGMRIMPYIEGARRLLVLDVIRAGRQPGALVRLGREEVPRHMHRKLSPHQIDLSEVFALAELRGMLPAELVALGVEPASVELRDALSEKVEDALPALIEAARSQLAAWGHDLAPKVPPSMSEAPHA